MPKVTKAPSKGYYAVHAGKTKGIYFTWPDCEKQVRGFPGAKYKKFETQKEAEQFVRYGPRAPPKPAKGAGTSIATSVTYARPSPYAASTRTGSSAASVAKADLVKPSALAAATTKANKDISTNSDDTQASTSEAIVIYTDGSSLSNGKAGSRAGLGVFFGVNDPRNVSERLNSEPQTNQRAELMAVYRALEVCGSDTKPIEIRTDSMYTLNIVTKWADGWIKKNWKRSDGGKVMNRDIIEPLITRIKSRPGPIKWVHVKAHVGTFGNEMADRLANEGAVMPKASQLGVS